MKTAVVCVRPQSFAQSSLFLLAAMAAIRSSALGATNIWVGGTSNDFSNAANWTGAALPNFGTDIMRFDGTGTQGNSTITGVNLTMTNTGTSAGTSLSQILFNTSTPALTLSGGTISLSTAATNTFNDAIVLSFGSTVTQTIGSNIVIDDGKAYTASFVNSANSGSGAVLAFTGNIAGGSGALTAGAISLGFGNTNTHNGDYSVSGNITAGGSTGVNITKRGTGILTLSGTNTLGNGTAGGLAQNEAGKIIIAGGTTTVNNIIDSANALGGNNVASTLQISGGTLNVNGARSLRTDLLVNCGTFNIGTVGTGGRLSLDSGRTFTMSSGAINLNSTTGGFGVRFGGDSGPGAAGFAFAGTQSGGVFTVKGAGGQQTVFQMGNTTTAVTTTYDLSGGTLDIQGTGTNAYLTLGAAANDATSSATFTLSGTGKLIVRSVTTAGSGGNAGVSGVNGFTANATQVFALSGGTLVAGRVDATNLRATAGGVAGTIVNNGTNISAGDAGFSGRTAFVGGLSITSGTMSFDLGGTTASSAWQHAASSGRYDNVAVTGAVTLGGNLSVSFIDGFLPTVGNSFTLLSGSSVSSSFVNAASTYIVTSGGNYYTFNLGYNPANVTLTLATVTSAIPEPSAYAALAGVGILGFATMRRRRQGV